MILKYLSSYVTEYLDSTLQGVLGSLECGARQFLFGACVFLSGAAFVLFGAFMVLAGIFLQMSQKPQFLIPALVTAGISVLTGSLLLKGGSCMSKLTRRQTKTGK